MFHDEEDMRYINFRYTDNKVVPDPLTGYYPYDDMKYGKFLNSKDDKFASNYKNIWDYKDHGKHVCKEHVIELEVFFLFI